MSENNKRSTPASNFTPPTERTEAKRDKMTTTNKSNDWATYEESEDKVRFLGRKHRFFHKVCGILSL